MTLVNLTPINEFCVEGYKLFRYANRYKPDPNAVESPMIRSSQVYVPGTLYESFNVTNSRKVFEQFPHLYQERADIGQAEYVFYVPGFHAIVNLDTAREHRNPHTMWLFKQRYYLIKKVRLYGNIRMGDWCPPDNAESYIGDFMEILPGDDLTYTD